MHLQSLQDYFDNTWMLTESLFAGLQGEGAFMRAPLHGLRHPMVFYYGHTAALYVNKLRAAGIVQVLAGFGAGGLSDSFSRNIEERVRGEGATETDTKPGSRYFLEQKRFKSLGFTFAFAWWYHRPTGK